jgi:hypothetical protein
MNNRFKVLYPLPIRQLQASNPMDTLSSLQKKKKKKKVKNTLSIVGKRRLAEWLKW